jgi:integrase
MITIETHNDLIRLRFRHQKKYYSLRLGRATAESVVNAQFIVRMIEIDILNDSFDETLERYRQEKKTKSKGPISPGKDQRPISLLFKIWTKDIRNKDINTSSNYYWMNKLIEGWGNYEVMNTPGLLSKQNWGPSTYNNRLSYFNQFYKWLVSIKRIESNPLEFVNRRKMVTETIDRRKPLSLETISKFLEAVKNDTYLAPNSNWTHSHYYPFLFFCFCTGVRNAEAVGLQVKHIDYENSRIRIESVLARGLTSTNANARVRKETKNGKNRSLPLDGNLIGIFDMLNVRGRALQDLVFKSPQGKAIDDRMLLRRIIRPIAQKLEIPDFDLYAARHSFGSRAIQQNLSKLDVAALMGDRVDTVLRNYVDPIEKPANLPSFGVNFGPKSGDSGREDEKRFDDQCH